MAVEQTLNSTGNKDNGITSYGFIDLRNLS